ncbi:MAG: hypothetical protein LBP89_01870, partial [Helicobacteraceae bacterium]|nr:hypothetical protein [Helicobacteraceae bacterium]
MTSLLASFKKPLIIARLAALIFILAYIISFFSDRSIGSERSVKTDRVTAAETPSIGSNRAIADENEVFAPIESARRFKRFNSYETRMHPYYKDDVHLENIIVSDNFARRFKHNGSLTFVVDKNASLKDRDGVIMQVFADNKLIAEQAENPYLYEGASKPVTVKFNIPKGTKELKLHILGGKNPWNDGTRVSNIEVNRANPLPTIIFWLSFIFLVFPKNYYSLKTWFPAIKSAFTPITSGGGGGGGKTPPPNRKLC